MLLCGRRRAVFVLLVLCVSYIRSDGICRTVLKVAYDRSRTERQSYVVDASYDCRLLVFCRVLSVRTVRLPRLLRSWFCNSCVYFLLVSEKNNFSCCCRLTDAVLLLMICYALRLGIVIRERQGIFL